MKKQHALLLIGTLPWLLPAAIAFGLPRWERANQSPAAEMTALVPHPLDSGKLIVSSARELFEGSGNGTWKNLWRSGSPAKKIHRLLSFKERPEEIFVLTADGAFAGDLKRKKWTGIYRGKTALEKSVLSFTILPGDPDHWFVGTEGGLFESDDAGKTWFRFSRFPSREAIPVLRFSGNRLFVATRDRLYVSENLTTFLPVFSLTSGDALEFLEIEDGIDTEEGSDSIGPADFHEMITAPTLTLPLQDEGGGKGRGVLWLASEKGVFESTDGGQRWNALSRSGLKSSKIEHLVYSEKGRRLFAGSRDGIYEYLFKESRWEELFRGLARPETFGLALLTDGEKERLTAATADGLMQYPLISDGVRIVAPRRTNFIDFSLFQDLIRLEPTAREIQQAVVRYANLKNGKIRRWQAESRLAALLPTFSFGRDFSRGNNVDLDRGATNTADEFILGPDDLDEGWQADVRWDLGNFIWSSNQTSIDSREKLMVELRADFLAEATRIYYERRRLQMEIVFSPAASEQEHFERLVRLDELTSLLDGMTNGDFTKRLEEIYAEKPELAGLWEFRGEQETTAPVQPGT